MSDEVEKMIAEHARGTAEVCARLDMFKDRKAVDAYEARRNEWLRKQTQDVRDRWTEATLVAMGY
jgi:hypothetical protein